jgi:hypothetical protein
MLGNRYLNENVGLHLPSRCVRGEPCSPFSLGWLNQRSTKSSCTLHFDDFEFCFCWRDCNKVAHEFAQYGVRAGLPISEWIEHSLDFVSGLVASDSAEQVF